jgi:hypothetical protein
MDYETTVKKLISVFKSKSPSSSSVDQLKEIELLWESVNKSHSNGQTSEYHKSATIKRSASDLQQIKASLNKKQKLTSPLSKHMDDSTSSSSDTVKASKSSQVLSSKNSIVSGANSLNINLLNDAKSSSTRLNDFSTQSADQNDDDEKSSNIDEYVIEMGLTCDTCKYVLNT